MIIPQANILAIRAFGGMTPRMSQYHIQDSAAVESENVNMLRGVLEPLKANEPIKVAPRTKGLIAYDRDKFITLDRKNDGHVVIGPRIVFTDTEGPSYIVTADYDDDADPPAKYRFGMPDLLEEWKDGNTPHVLDISPTGEGTPTGTKYRYAISVVNKWGDESAVSMSVLGDELTVRTTFDLSMSIGQATALRALLDGHEFDGMKVRLYRAVIGAFLQIQEVPFPADGSGIDFDTDNVSDTIVNRDSGRTFVSKVNDGIKVRLPDDAKGFVWHPNGFMACYATVDGVDYVYFSSPLSLSHFPEQFRLDPHGGRIVALEEYGNRIVIFFDDAPPKTIDIAHPERPRLHSPEIAHRTSSGASVSKSARGIIYASRDGIVITNGITGQLMETMFDAESFNRYAPQDIRGFATDLDYYMFGPGRENFLLQRLTMMTHLGEVITDMSQWSDHVYALISDVIMEMFASRDDILRQAKWRSKKFQFHRPTLLKCAKMSADYDRFNVETLTGGLGLLDEVGEIIPGDFSQIRVLQEDPAQVHIRVIKDDDEFVVDGVQTSWPWNFVNRHGARKSTTFQVEITTNTPVYFVAMAPNIRTLDAVQVPTVANIEGARNGNG